MYEDQCLQQYVAVKLLAKNWQEFYLHQIGSDSDGFRDIQRHYNSTLLSAVQLSLNNLVPWGRELIKSWASWFESFLLGHLSNQIYIRGCSGTFFHIFHLGEDPD